MKSVYLLLGGNIGNVEKTFEDAYALLNNHLGNIEKKSSLYLTKAWGKTNQPDYLNQLCVIKSNLLPEQILKITQKIEIDLGRKRLEHWGERTLDIDILFIDDMIYESFSLEIPHPRIQERNFVLYPLKEAAPNFVHPVFGKTIEELTTECKDELGVEIVDLSSSEETVF